MHTQQLLPAIGCILVAARVRHAKAGLVLASAAYVGLIVFTFVQALHGEPFLGFLG